jgi:hypothetical protein
MGCGVDAIRQFFAKEDVTVGGDVASKVLTDGALGDGQGPRNELPIRSCPAPAKVNEYPENGLLRDIICGGAIGP